MYDPIYGINRKRITQDSTRNNYVGSTGWWDKWHMYTIKVLWVRR
jgi:hypothetical protein